MCCVSCNILITLSLIVDFEPFYKLLEDPMFCYYYDEPTSQDSYGKGPRRAPYHPALCERKKKGSSRRGTKILVYVICFKDFYAIYISDTSWGG